MGIGRSGRRARARRRTPAPTPPALWRWVSSVSQGSRGGPRHPRARDGGKGQRERVKGSPYDVLFVLTCLALRCPALVNLTNNTVGHSARWASSGTAENRGLRRASCDKAVGKRPTKERNLVLGSRGELAEVVLTRKPVGEKQARRLGCGGSGLLTEDPLPSGRAIARSFLPTFLPLGAAVDRPPFWPPFLAPQVRSREAFPVSNFHKLKTPVSNTTVDTCI